MQAMPCSTAERKKTANVSCTSASVAPSALVRRAEEGVRKKKQDGRDECFIGWGILSVTGNIDDFAPFLLYSHRKDNLSG